MVPVLQQGLAKIGIALKPRELATGAVFTTFQTVANKIPLVHAGWAKDYADPVTFAAPLFGGSSIIPVRNTNHALIGLTREQAAELKVAYPEGGIPSVDADIPALPGDPQLPGRRAPGLLDRPGQEAHGTGRPLGPDDLGRRHRGVRP